LPCASSGAPSPSRSFQPASASSRRARSASRRSPAGESSRGNQAPGRRLAEPDHALGEGGLVDGEREGAPHAGNRERVRRAARQGWPAVEAEEVGAEVRHQVHVAALAHRRRRQRRERLVDGGSRREELVVARAVPRQVRA
jgi:hypothetical protein